MWTVTELCTGGAARPVGAAAAFLGMWVAMMAAMMLPSVAPALWRYRVAAVAAPAGFAYLGVWTAIGAAAYALGIALANFRIPLLALADFSAVVDFGPRSDGVIVVAAGLVQFTRWKSRRLACCRRSVHAVATDGITAWRQGLRLGLDCAASCANLMAVLWVLGMMDLVVMALVTAAITVERLAPRSELAMRAIGAVTVATGLAMVGG
jgi:predicted metal-binding membrane protein